MTQLCDLPPELLQAICLRHEAIQLWQCGYKSKLMPKLATGINTVQLSDLKLNSSSILPKCLFSFSNLRDLSIDRGKNRLMSPEHLSLALQDLSPKLERLELTCKGALTCFVDYSPTSISLRTAPSSSDGRGTEESISTAASTIPRVWSLKTRFPALKALHISDPLFADQQTRLPFIWSPADIEMLPPTLSSLRLGAAENIEPRAFSRLPRGLQTIEVGFEAKAMGVDIFPMDITAINPCIQHIWTQELCESLPPSLTSLGPFGPPIPLDQLPYLPNTMEHLRIQLKPESNSWHMNFPDTLSPPDLSTFTNLTHLYFEGGHAIIAHLSNSNRYFEVSWLKALPRSLVSLQLPSRPAWENYNAALRLEHLIHLPKGLIQLFVGRLQPANVIGDVQVLGDVNSAALSNLRSLTVYSGFTDVSSIACIPQSLTSLKIHSAAYNLCIGLQEVKFPPNLKTFHWSQTCPPLIAPLLPRGLTRLSLVSRDSIWKPSDTKALPRNLTELSLSFAHITEDACACLPETLLELTVAGIYPVQDSNTEITPPHAGSSFSPNRAHSRTKLDVSAEGLPQGLKLLDLSGAGGYSAKLISTLPRGLTSLLLSSINMNHPNMIQSLPKGLKSLQTTGIGVWRDSDIDALPKSLTHLMLALKANPELSPDLSHVLPPHIDRQHFTSFSIIH